MKRFMPYTLVVIALGSLLPACESDSGTSPRVERVVVDYALDVDMASNGQVQITVRKVITNNVDFEHVGCWLKELETGEPVALGGNEFGFDFVNDRLVEGEVVVWCRGGVGTKTVNVVCRDNMPPRLVAQPIPSPTPRQEPAPTPNPKPAPTPYPTPTPTPAPNPSLPLIVSVADSDIVTPCGENSRLLAREESGSEQIASCNLVSGPRTGPLNKDGRVWTWDFRPCLDNGHYILRCKGVSGAMRDFNITVQTPASCGC